MADLVATLATAATALIIERLRRELREERAQRQAQDAEIMALREKLDAAGSARLNAALEVDRLTSEAAIHRKNLRDGEKEQARLTAGLHSALAEGRRFEAAKDTAEAALAQLRRRIAAGRSQVDRSDARSTRQQEQIQKLREHNREKAKELRGTKRKLLGAERRITKLLAPSMAEDKLRAEVERLTKQFDAAQAHEDELSRKVKRLKKRNARLLDEAVAEDDPGWFGRLFGDSGSGQSRRSKRLATSSRKPKAELPARSTRGLPQPSPRKMLAAKSET